jgi:glycosyltransferase involved in cell wall biosynthesis
MSTLRVLHLIQCLHGYGAERQVRDLIPYLQSDDMTVGALSVYGSRLTEDELEALPFTTIDVGRRSRADYSFLPRLVREIRRFRPDIVHAHTHSGKYWGRVAAWLSGVKTVVFTEHNPCDPRRSRIERFADPLLHAKTSRIVTFLNDQRRVLSRTDHVKMEKIVVIANGLLSNGDVQKRSREEGRKLLCVSNDEFAVLLIGRLEYQKNQQLALRALAAMEEEQRRKIRLFLAGAGTEEVKLRGLARALQVEEQVRFLGYRSDVPTLLAGADLLLMTSLFEGMPLTLIEAMNAGVPVLSTPWIGASEMLGNGRYGFIAPGWDPKDVSGEILRVLNNCGARVAVAEHARTYAGDMYDIRRMAEAHRRLYLELCPGVAYSGVA